MTTKKEKVALARAWLALQESMILLNKAKEQGADSDYIDCYIDEMCESQFEAEFVFNDLPDEEDEKCAYMKKFIE